MRSVAAEHSERPIYFVFPAFRSSSKAGMDSSRAVSSQAYELMESLPPWRIEEKLTGIDSVEIVQVRCEAKPLHCPFNILLDVSGRICDASISTVQAVEAALGGD